MPYHSLVPISPQEAIGGMMRGGVDVPETPLAPPARPERAYPDITTGGFGRLGDRIVAGFDRPRAAAPAPAPAPVAEPSSELGTLGHFSRSAERGYRSLQQLRNLYGLSLGEDPEKNVARIAEIERMKRSLPASEAIQKFSRAEGISEAFEAFLEAPIDVMGNLTIESLG